MDHVIGNPVVVERRAARAAKAPFHLERALEHGRLAAAPFDRPLLHGEAREERSPDRLLAHPAVTDTHLVWCLTNHIANRTALTAAGQLHVCHDCLLFVD